MHVHNKRMHQSDGPVTALAGNASAPAAALLGQGRAGPTRW